VNAPVAVEYLHDLLRRAGSEKARSAADLQENSQLHHFTTHQGAKVKAKRKKR
jgi:hypothetical protein